MIFFSSYLSQNAVIILTILLLFVAVVFSIYCVLLLIGWFISADCIMGNNKDIPHTWSLITIFVFIFTFNVIHSNCDESLPDVNIMVCPGRTRLLASAAGAITKQITCSNDKTQQQGRWQANFPLHEDILSTCKTNANTPVPLVVCGPHELHERSTVLFYL